MIPGKATASLLLFSGPLGVAFLVLVCVSDLAVTGRRLSLRQTSFSGEVRSLVRDGALPPTVHDGVTDVAEENGLVRPEAPKTAWQEQVKDLNVSSRHNGTVEDLPHIDTKVEVPVTALNQTEAPTTGDGKQPGFNFVMPDLIKPKCLTPCVGEDEYCPSEGANCQRLPIYYRVPKKTCYPDPSFPQMELERKQACRTLEMRVNETTCVGNEDCVWRSDAPFWFKRLFEQGGSSSGLAAAMDDRKRRRLERKEVKGASQDALAGHLAGVANNVLDPLGAPTVPPAPTTPAPLANETEPQGIVGVNASETAPPPTPKPTNITNVIMEPLVDVPVAPPPA